MNILLKALTFSHLLMSRVVKSGDLVVDATAGNGHDTVFLAKLVGEKGTVFSIDIQQQAITKTKENLIKNELLERTRLIQDGHENIASYINDKISAAMFNLGYLPGSNHQVITKPETTIEALKGILTLLVPNGLITLVIYTGHPGGEREWSQLENYLCSLNTKDYQVLLYKFLSQQKSPFWWQLKKSKKWLEKKYIHL